MTTTKAVNTAKKASTLEEKDVEGALAPSMDPQVREKLKQNRKATEISITLRSVVPSCVNPDVLTFKDDSARGIFRAYSLVR